MQVIVVLNGPLILVVDLCNELKELVMINGLEQVIVFQQ
jgi:hypothetical protein